MDKLDLKHRQDIQGPFFVYQHSCRQPAPWSCSITSPHVLTWSSCALACFWCGVEAGSVHTSHSVSALHWPTAAIRGFGRRTQHGKWQVFVIETMYLVLSVWYLRVKKSKSLFSVFKSPSSVLFLSPPLPSSSCFFFALWSGHACQKGQMLSINRLITS